MASLLREGGAAEADEGARRKLRERLPPSI